MSKKITTSVQTEGFEAVLYPGDGRKDRVLLNFVQIVFV